MNKFNLEVVKNGGAAVVNGLGQSVSIILYDAKIRGGYSVVGMVLQEDGTEEVHVYTKCGRSISGLQDMDLRIAPIKRTGWVNLYSYPNCSRIDTSPVHESEEAAKTAASLDSQSAYIGTFPIDYEA